MSDIRKAAILLMSLPEEQAVQLMAKLAPKQVEQVSIEIAKLGGCSGEEQENVIIEFAEANPNSMGGCGRRHRRGQIAGRKGPGQQAPRPRSTLCGSRSRPCRSASCKRSISQNLLTFIIDEHPQTIALMLSHLPPAYGAEIIKRAARPSGSWPSSAASPTMGQTNPEVIHEVEKGLERRMSSVMSQQFENAGGVNSVAEILNVSDRATERSLLEDLAQEDPELVEEIRRLMFVFEDIGKLCDKDIQTVLKNVETPQWAMALKGASDELKQKILGNMSQRAAAMLTRRNGIPRAASSVSEVEQVQQQIVDIVRRLEDAGEITVHAADESEQMIT